MEKQIQVDGLTQTVLRSDPDGVKLLSSYPSISDDPGVEPWKDEESWEAKKVFAALQKWKFHQGGDAHRAMWSKLQRWYKAHPDAQSIPIGDVDCLDGMVANAHSLPSCTWGEMWKLLSLEEDVALSGGASSSKDARVGPKVAFHAPTSRRVDREALSKSTSAAELNRVRHAGNTSRDVAVAVAHDQGAWECHLATQLAVAGVLWLIRLEHFEGEFALGLGRRTFATSDTESHVEIEWFERKNKKQLSWGKQPGFRRAVAEFDRRRQPIYQKSVEKITNFLPIIASATPKSTINEPILSQICMDAIRVLLPTKRGTSDSDSVAEEEDDGDEEEDGSHGDGSHGESPKCDLQASSGEEEGSSENSSEQEEESSSSSSGDEEEEVPCAKRKRKAAQRE